MTGRTSLPGAVRLRLQLCSSCWSPLPVWEGHALKAVVPFLERTEQGLNHCRHMLMTLHANISRVYRDLHCRYTKLSMMLALQESIALWREVTQAFGGHDHPGSIIIVHSTAAHCITTG